MPKQVCSLLLFIFLAAGFMVAGHIFAATANADDHVMEASGPKWLEERQDAASFASDWLTDLDNGNYAAAAKQYKMEENRGEGVKDLRALRKGLSSLVSRTYNWANVVAIANDDSELVVQVSYTTEFSERSVTELVNVLIWPKTPVVLEYGIENE